MAELYEEGRCCFKKINFAGNNKISQIGAVRLASALKENENIRSISFNGISLGTHGAKYQIYLCLAE